MLSDPEEAARLGANGRKLIEREMNLDLYAQRLAGYLSDAVNAEKGPENTSGSGAARALGQLFNVQSCANNAGTKC